MENAGLNRASNPAVATARQTLAERAKQVWESLAVKTSVYFPISILIQRTSSNL
jgi:hypothetical protein